MKYLFLLLPLALFILSAFYNNKYNKVKHTGKVPVIVAAKRNTAIFFALALITILIIFLVFKLAD